MRSPFIWAIAIIANILVLVFLYASTSFAPQFMQNDDSKGIVLFAGELLAAIYYLNVYQVADFKLSWKNISSVPIQYYLLIVPSFLLLYAIDRLNRILADHWWHGPVAIPGKPTHVLVLLLLAGALCAPVVEEILFRGLLFSWLQKKMSLLGAIIVSALVFSVTHFNPAGFAMFTAAGVIFAWLTWKSRSLWPAIFLHMAWNAIAILYNYWVK